MIVKFKSNQIDEIDELLYEASMWKEGSLFTDPELGKCEDLLCFAPYRIVVPELHKSFRLGDLYEIDEDDFDNSEPTGDAIVAEFDENEKDANEYIYWQTTGLEGALDGIYDCYIDTSEFNEDEEDFKNILKMTDGLELLKFAEGN